MNGKQAKFLRSIKASKEFKRHWRNTPQNFKRLMRQATYIQMPSDETIKNGGTFFLYTENKTYRVGCR